MTIYSKGKIYLFWSAAAYTCSTAVAGPPVESPAEGEDPVTIPDLVVLPVGASEGVEGPEVGVPCCVLTGGPG